MMTDSRIDHETNDLACIRFLPKEPSANFYEVLQSKRFLDWPDLYIQYFSPVKRFLSLIGRGKEENVSWRLRPSARS